MITTTLSLPAGNGENFVLSEILPYIYEIGYTDNKWKNFHRTTCVNQPRCRWHSAYEKDALYYELHYTCPGDKYYHSVKVTRETVALLESAWLDKWVTAYRRAHRNMAGNKSAPIALGSAKMQSTSHKRLVVYVNRGQGKNFNRLAAAAGFTLTKNIKGYLRRWTHPDGSELREDRFLSWDCWLSPAVYDKLRDASRRIRGVLTHALDKDFMAEAKRSHDNEALAMLYMGYHEIAYGMYIKD